MKKLLKKSVSFFTFQIRSIFLFLKIIFHIESIVTPGDPQKLYSNFKKVGQGFFFFSFSFFEFYKNSLFISITIKKVHLEVFLQLHKIHLDVLYVS